MESKAHRRIPEIRERDVGGILLAKPIPFDLKLLELPFSPDRDVSIARCEVPGYENVIRVYHSLFKSPLVQLALEEDKIVEIYSRKISIGTIQDRFEPAEVEPEILKKFLKDLLGIIQEEALTAIRLEEKEQAIAEQLDKEMSKREQEFKELKQFSIPKQCASSDDLKEAVIVPEHAFALMKIKDPTLCLGTFHIYSCIGIAAVNSSSGLLAVAHLDKPTITTYEESLRELLELLNAKNETVNFYITADTTVTKEQLALMGLHSDATKTLLSSLLDFLKEYDKVKINLYPLPINNWIVKMDRQGASSILRVDDSNLNLMIKRCDALDQGHFDACINFRPLIRLGGGPSLPSDVMKPGISLTPR